MEATMTATTGQRAGRKEWIGLAVLGLPTLLISIDVFVLLLALPRLTADLGAGSTQQLWIMDIYGFMVAGFLVTMGTLGDRIGRRKLLLIGAAGFGLASVAAAYSGSAGMLIASRALLGIAGATLAPSSLALISNMFRDPKQRSFAIGVWIACFVGGATVGPVVGGVMLEHFWWGSVFLLGLPAMAVLLLVGRVLLPEHRDESAGRIDLLSVALSLATILPIIFGLKELARHGLEAVPVAAITTGLLIGAAFVRRQRRLDDPLIDLSLFANRAFTSILVSMMLGTMLMGSVMVFITQYFQLVRGLSPLEAGLWMVPGMLASLITFQVAPLIARRIRPAYMISGGMIGAIAGLLIVASAAASGDLPMLVTGFVLCSLGAGPLVTLGTDLVVGSATPERAGSAASISETSNEFGFALGIAVLGSIGTAVYRAGLDLPRELSAGAARAARESLAGAVETAATLPQRLGAQVLETARNAFTTELQLVALLSALVMAGVAVLIYRNVRHVTVYGDESAEPAQAADVEAAEEVCA